MQDRTRPARRSIDRRTTNRSTEFTNTLGMKFKLIPAGKFTMGSPKEEIDRCLKQYWSRT